MTHTTRKAGSGPDSEEPVSGSRGPGPGFRTDPTLPRSSPFAEGFLPAMNFFLFRTAAGLAERLPYAAGNRFALFAARCTYRLATRRRRLVRSNLRRVVGAGPHLEPLVRKAFESYAEHWLETFRLGKYTKDDLEELIVVSDQAVRAMEDALSEKKGVLVITPHFGLYDLGCAWMGSRGWPLTTVTEVLRPRALYEWFTERRSRWGVQIVPAERGQLTRRIGKIIANGEVLALVADRDLGRRGVWTEFFGEATTLPATPPALMARRNIPLLLGAMYKEEGRLRAIFERIPYELSGDEEADIATCAGVVARTLESVIRRSPEQWHLFSPNWPSDEPGLPPRGSERNRPPEAASGPPASPAQ